PTAPSANMRWMCGMSRCPTLPAHTSARRAGPAEHSPAARRAARPTLRGRVAPSGFARRPRGGVGACGPGAFAVMIVTRRPLRGGQRREGRGAAMMVHIVKLPVLVLGLCALSLGAIQAQDYPTRTVKIIVPFPAGGTADAMPRLIGDWLSR